MSSLLFLITNDALAAAAAKHSSANSEQGSPASWERECALGIMHPIKPIVVDLPKKRVERYATGSPKAESGPRPIPGATKRNTSIFSQSPEWYGIETRKAFAASLKQPADQDVLMSLLFACPHGIVATRAQDMLYFYQYQTQKNGVKTTKNGQSDLVLIQLANKIKQWELYSVRR